MRALMILLLATLLLTLAPSEADAAKLRTWKSADGEHTLRGTFVQLLKNGDVAIRTPDDKLYAIPLEKLRYIDQLQVKSASKASPKAPATTTQPVTPMGSKKIAGKPEAPTGESGEPSTSPSPGSKSTGPKKPLLTGSPESGPEESGKTEEVAKKSPKKRKKLYRSRPSTLDNAGKAQTGKLVPEFPLNPKAWVNSGPLSRKALGNKAVVFVFYEERSYYMKEIFPEWLDTVKEYRGKPVLFVAVISGQSAKVVSKSLQLYGANWRGLSDSTRQFERLMRVAKLSRGSYSYGLRPVDGKGNFLESSPYLGKCADKALKNASWRVDREEVVIPKELEKAWQHVEFGKFDLAGSLIKGRMKSKLPVVKTAADALNEAVQKELKVELEKADKAYEEGYLFDAYLHYKELTTEYKKYGISDQVKERAKELLVHPDLKRHILAWKKYNKARALIGKKKTSQVKTALEKVTGSYPKTLAAEEAKKLKRIL